MATTETKQVLLRLNDNQLEQLNKIQAHYEIATVNQTAITLINTHMELLNTCNDLRAKVNKLEQLNRDKDMQISEYAYAWQTLNRLIPSKKEK